MTRRSPSSSWQYAAPLAGLLALAAALGVAELLAALTHPEASPIVAVGGEVVDASPAPLKEFAIRTFGAADKSVLIAGIVVLLAAAAAAIGVRAVRRPAGGVLAVAALGVVGAAAAVARPGGGPVDVLPSLVGAACGAAALLFLLRRLPRDTPVPAGEAGTSVPEEKAPGIGGRDQPGGRPGDRPFDPLRDRPGDPPRDGLGDRSRDRRSFLTGALAVAGVAAASGATGSLLVGPRRGVAAARASVTLPSPDSPARALPAGADLRIPGLSRFVTPNADFYRVDTALLLPRVAVGTWTLRVHGMVDHPLELTFDELLARTIMERDVTLACVSNEVGGPYVGNARWLGVSLADLLREAGVQARADQILSRSADGWTCGTPTEVVMDGRDAMLAFGMNGEPLPVAHGFPVRMVVPGLYGYVSATKWVVDLELTRFDLVDAYWVPRGWAEQAPVKTMSRIDTPRTGARLSAGKIPVAGVAWAQHRGIDAVEVRVDEGRWRQARLAAVPGPDTWRQWVYDWDAEAGEHTIEVRATDGTGRTQPAFQRPPIPDGATGWHAVDVTVE